MMTAEHLDGSRQQGLLSHHGGYRGRSSGFPWNDVHCGVGFGQSCRDPRYGGFPAVPGAQSCEYSAACSGETTGADCGWNNAPSLENEGWRDHGHQGLPTTK